MVGIQIVLDQMVMVQEVVTVLDLARDRGRTEEKTEELAMEMLGRRVV